MISHSRDGHESIVSGCLSCESNWRAPHDVESIRKFVEGALQEDSPFLHNRVVLSAIYWCLAS